MNWPSTRATRTATSGPAQFRSEIISAAEPPVMASTSGGCSVSADSTVAITWVSKRHALGNSGRYGRSIRRQTSVSVSVARASRRK